MLSGHVQRVGPPTAFDRVLSTRSASPPDAVHDPRLGEMVVLKAESSSVSPLTVAVGRTRGVDLSLYHDVAAIFFA